MMILPEIVTINLTHSLENSFRDFHAKGFDYICLSRGAKETLKFYLFDQFDRRDSVVNPHNHRYDFTTKVLAGEMHDIRYRAVDLWQRGLRFQQYDFRTPLLKGDGFTYTGESTLKVERIETVKEGEELFSPAEAIHTIRVKPNTVLMLKQGEDVVVGPTQCWARNGEPTLDDGLYRKFTADELLFRIRDLSQLTGIAFRVT